MKHQTNPTGPRGTLRSGCLLLEGAARGAIYDLNTRRVFSLNAAAMRVVLGKVEDDHFWERLSSLGLAARTCPDAYPSRASSVAEPTLEFLWLEMLSECNLSCVHCYAATSSTEHTRRQSLAHQDWLDLIHQASDLGCRRIQFTGGEPLLYTDLFQLASFARDIGFHEVEFFTNGTLLTEDKVTFMKELDLAVAVSVYSHDPNIHDSITGLPGSYSRTLGALRMLRSAGIPTRVSVTVMDQNQTTVPQTRELLNALGLGPVQVDVVRPVGRGGDRRLIPDPSLAGQWLVATDTGFSIDRQRFQRNKHWNPCWAGKAVVTETGDVLPCVFARHLVVGNVQKQTLHDIVYGAKLQGLWGISKDGIHVCKDCEFRYACSDCRVLAMAETGNILAKTPRCCYDPRSGTWTD